VIESLLIANRGEIARRVIRTAKRLGVRTVAVFSEADAAAPHVREADAAVAIGPAPARESYLVAERIIEAAKETGAAAIHPGYGFLSENAAFARACQTAGIVFVGPDPASIEAMGLKDKAKALMEQAGVPVTPGYHGENQDDAHLAAEAERIGYPVLIKAVAGGGGKGMRRVDEPGAFLDALASCRREAEASFGDANVLIEKFILNPRHIEVQVFGDRHGNAIHLYERDCSLQRRHQKVIEEAPAPGMTDAVRSAMTTAAVRAARAVDYVGAGTVEFIVDGSGPLREDGFFFMEMNTRLQVEHPVTEEVTGLDLVELQLRVASGESLPPQDDIRLFGHAVEARLYAEDPASGFLPSTGRLARLELPHDVRVDSGVEEGGAVTLHYDPMIAKLIAFAETREAALSDLADALADVQVYPVKTNAGFLRRLAEHERFVEFDVDTGFIDAQLSDLAPAGPDPVALAIAAAAAFADAPAQGWRDPWGVKDGFRLNAPERLSIGFNLDGARGEARYSDGALLLDLPGRDRQTMSLRLLGVDAGDTVHALIDGHLESADILRAPGRIIVFRNGETQIAEVWPGPLSLDELAAGDVVKAPMPGKVLGVKVTEGQAVKKGDTLVVLEAMKMEHGLAAPRDGVIASVGVAAGAQVGDGDMLVALEEEDGAPA